MRCDTTAHALELRIMADCQREIVCNFEGRRRPVTFPAREDPKEENKGLLAAVKTTFADLLSEENDGAYFLQVDSEKHGLIDVVDVRVAKDEKVFLRLWKPGGSKDEVMTGAMSV